MNDHKHLLDWLIWASAGLAAVSLAQAAFALTITATIVSIILGCIRIHDRLKYGPRGYRGE